MILYSTRKNEGLLGQAMFGPTRVWDPSNPDRHYNRHAVHAAGSDGHVLIMVHGYRTDFESAANAYRETAARFENFVKGPEPQFYGYDAVIGFFWPGSFLRLGFMPSVGRARQAGKRLRELLYWLGDAPSATLDIMTHSLGAVVALESLASLHPRCRLLMLTGAAVEYSCFEPGQQYRMAANHAEEVHIFHSRRDEVLGKWYPFGRPGQIALGLGGPRPHGELPPNLTCHDLTGEVPGHSDYRRAPSLYAAWAERFESLTPDWKRRSA